MVCLSLAIFTGAQVCSTFFVLLLRCTFGLFLFIYAIQRHLFFRTGGFGSRLDSVSRVEGNFQFFTPLYCENSLHGPRSLGSRPIYM